MGTKKSNKLYAAAAALAVTASAVAPGLTADAASKVTVKSITAPKSISHYGGYTFAVKKLSLPKTVKVLLSNKKYENRSVKWGKVSYDKKYIGKYQTISGTVAGTTKKATIKVKLNNYPVDVIEPKGLEVAEGGKLALPKTLTVVYKSGSKAERSLSSFQLGKVATDKPGTFKVSYSYIGNNSKISGSISYKVIDSTPMKIEAAEKAVKALEDATAELKTDAAIKSAEGLVKPAKDAVANIPAGNVAIAPLNAKIELAEKKIADAMTSLKERRAIESISAINATDATVAVTFANELTASDLEGKKIALKGSQSLTASFVKLDGKVATFKVDQDILNKAAYDGSYTVEADFSKVSNLKTTYSAVVAGTFVEGFVFNTNSLSEKVALADATVKIDGKTVKTDKNGYYQVAVNPGLKTVEISKGNDFFVKEVTTAEVARNNSTVVNQDLVAIDATKLFFTGTVLDAKDSQAVTGASVQLQMKDDKGSWVDVSGYKVVTDTKGQFQFLNNAATVTAGAGASAKAATADKNVLAVGKEYRAVVEKKVTSSNLDNVYKQQTISFDLSNKKEETTKLINAEKVAELQELKVNLSWLKDATINGTVKVSFLNTDGSTALESFDLVKDTDFVLADSGRDFKEAVDIVSGKAKFANDTSATTTKPRLVAGTYFMVVENGSENAKKAFAVEVTEGGKASVKLDVEQAKTAQAKTLVDKVQYAKALYTDPKNGTEYPVNADPATEETLALTEISKALVREATKINASYAAYQTVAGKDIMISSTSSVPVTATFANKQVKSVSAADTTLNKLAASVTYKVKSTSDFLVGNSDLSVKPDAATNNVSATLNAATKLKTIELTDKVSTSKVTGAVTVKSLKLVDAEGKTVAEAMPNKEVTPSAGVISLTQLDSVGTDVSSKFENIKAGKYKLSIELAGYKGATSIEQELIDFQNGEIKVDVEKLKGTEVTGYIRDAKDGQSVAISGGTAEASVIAYDKYGDAVAATNFGTGAETTYSLKGLNAGEEYTFVVRGAGFETQSIKKTVVAEDLTSLNFDVVKGAQGQFKLQIVDADNTNMVSGAVKYVAKDAYYDVDRGTSDKTGAALTGITFKGDFTVTEPAGDASGTAARTFTVNNVSAGAYTLELSKKAASGDKYVLPQAYNLTLKDINGTAYATSNGTEIIKVPLVSGVGSLDVALNLTFTGTATGGADDIDYVQVLDLAGNIVKTVRAGSLADKALVSVKVPNNSTYMVKAYLNNGFVATDMLTVQNNDVAKTIFVTQATR